MLRLPLVPSVPAARIAQLPESFHHAVGEGKLRAAPAAQKAPWATVSARLIPVPLAPQEEDDLPAPGARERQTSTYLYPGYAHDLPLWCIRSVPPSLTRPVCLGKVKRLEVEDG
jgi:hypothetical protein